LITLHDVDLAVREARRAVTELGVVGLSLCPEPVNGRRIHDRYYDPLWAEIERLGVALCFHPPADPKQEQVARGFYGHPNASIIALALRNPVELILAVSSFCAGGVLENFPSLRVAFLEGNCSWLPWLLYRLDERAELHGALADVPLSLKPSEYFKRQCFISVDPDEDLVADVIDRLGDDNIVISTDYPHIDAHFPRAVEEFLPIEGISRESKQKILWDNCARLYNLK
jgi:predicted TIM-barrel fold metal-dependent hydrolase